MKVDKAINGRTKRIDKSTIIIRDFNILLLIVSKRYINNKIEKNMNNTVNQRDLNSFIDHSTQQQQNKNSLTCTWNVYQDRPWSGS